MVGDLHLQCVIFQLSSFRTFDAIERIVALFSLGMDGRWKFEAWCIARSRRTRSHVFSLGIIHCTQVTQSI